MGQKLRRKIKHKCYAHRCFFPKSYGLRDIQTRANMPQLLFDATISLICSLPLHSPQFHRINKIIILKNITVATEGYKVKFLRPGSLYHEIPNTDCISASQNLISSPLSPQNRDENTKYIHQTKNKKCHVGERQSLGTTINNGLGLYSVQLPETEEYPAAKMCVQNSPVTMTEPTLAI